MTIPLRFHWSMSSAGGNLRGAQARGALAIQSLDSMLRFARHAEECGIESLLTAFGFHRPDPFTVAAALGALTTRIKFMQQVNTIAMLTGGRICLNIVAGHTPEEQGYYGDFLSHDERYERTDEFLRICAAFWKRDGDVNFAGRHYRVANGKLNIPFSAPDRTSPEIYLGGSSAVAEKLAIEYADCLWRLPDTPEKLRTRTLEIVEQGSEVGLLVSLIIRPTHDEAVRAADAILEAVGQQPKRTHEEFAKRSDSVAFTSTYKLAENSEWLTPYLWSGAVPYLGAPAMAIVGSPEEVADALFDFRAAGISQFLFMGWPDMEEMTNFHRDVLPLVRLREQREEARAV